MAELSVIVTSYESPRILERCLQALASQKEIAEIVVADCSRLDPAEELRECFPAVRFLHFDQPRTVPQLRWAALPETSGEIVGAIEARTIPARDWAAHILAAHHGEPEACAVGGPVRSPGAAFAFDLGLYFCEYGAFAPPLVEGPARALSGANLSYKRRALDENRDLLDAGVWETVLHERWLAQGKMLRTTNAAIDFVNTMSRPTALRQRFNYGRGYAAERIEFAPAWRRVYWAAISPLLPGLLVWRTLRGAAAKGLGPQAARSLGWILLLTCAWSAGEVVGYALGTPGRAKIF